MSQVTKLLNNLKSPKQNADEEQLVKVSQDYLSSAQFLIETLMDEDERSRNKCRWYKSKKIIEQAMVVKLLHEELIRTLVGFYLEEHGNTVFIDKIELYLANKVKTYLDAKIKPYLYLINVKDCQRQADDCC